MTFGDFLYYTGFHVEYTAVRVGRGLAALAHGAARALLTLLAVVLRPAVRAADGFLPLADALGYTPANAVDEYAVRIGDTPLGSYFSVLRGLDADTLLCVRRMSSFSFLKGQTRTEKYYSYCIDTFKKIFTFEAPTA
mgnify:CR=1 FL=1